MLRTGLSNENFLTDQPRKLSSSLLAGRKAGIVICVMLRHPLFEQQDGQTDFYHCGWKHVEGLRNILRMDVVCVNFPLQALDSMYNQQTHRIGMIRAPIFLLLLEINYS